MKANAIGHATDSHRTVELARIARDASRAARHESQTREVSQRQEVATAEAERTHRPERHQRDQANAPRGVLRLLEAGHFKGVADVRLRINFFEQLSARAETNARAGLQEQAPQLLETIRENVARLADTLAADQETRTAIDGLLDEFQAAAESAVSEFTSERSIDSQTLSDQLQTLFDSFVQQLDQLLSPPPTTGESTPDDPNDSAPAADADVAVKSVDALTPDNIPAAIERTAVERVLADDVEVGSRSDATEVVPDTTDEETPDDVVQVTTAEDAIASLQDAFSQALTDLLASFDSLGLLSDPSQPTGNGLAYDRFLAEYNQLRGLPTIVDERG